MKKSASFGNHIVKKTEIFSIFQKYAVYKNFKYFLKCVLKPSKCLKKFRSCDTHIEKTRILRFFFREKLHCQNTRIIRI